MKISKTTFAIAFVAFAALPVSTVIASSIKQAESTTAEPDRSAEIAQRRADAAAPKPSATTPLRVVVPDSRPPKLSETKLATPVIVERQNENLRSSALGELCWFRTELSLAFRDQLALQMGVPGKSRRVAVAVASDLAAWKVPDSLPASAIPFAQKLRSDAVESTNRGWISLEAKEGAPFDFDNYPGVREYLEAAKLDPACRQP